VRVAVYPADVGRCGHRLIWPAQALADQGADVDLVMSDEPTERQLQAQWVDDVDGAAHLLDVMAPDADVVVLQRPLQRTLVEAIPMLQGKGVRVVVEVDDDFSAMSRRNISWRACHPSTSPDRNWHHVAQACRLADLVTVTTPALARRYGGHGRVVIVPNHIPASYLDIERESRGGVSVGWTGSVATHPDDLQVTRGAVARAMRGTDARFMVVGTGKGVCDRLGLDAEPAATGWLPLDEYPHAVARLDVGIVPLELSAFNEAKSALKMTEFAALGVACVASPTGSNLAVPAGCIAHKPKDWERLLRTLIVDIDHRAEVAGHARAWAATQTVEGNCGQWFDAWASVGQRRLRQMV
jgi:hypothetical protein